MTSHPGRLDGAVAGGAGDQARMSRALAHLVLPRWCPGCGLPGVSVCRDCAAGLRHWFRAESAANALPTGLPVWAVGAYADETTRVLMAWKSGRRPDLARVLARLGTVIGAHLTAQTDLRAMLAGHDVRDLVLVPAPSGWRRRWRGREVVAPLAVAVAAGMRAGLGTVTGTGGPVSVQAKRLLRRRGGNNHRLSAKDRASERERSIGLAPRVGVPEGAGFILVDDILTTGATLAASARALASFGPVCGAIVLAATPKPVQRSNESAQDLATL